MIELFDRRARRRFWKNAGARVGVFLVALLVVFALVGPFFARHDPNLSDFVNGATPLGEPIAPNGTYWLGTDRIFRDVFVRLAYGARLSLIIAISATVISTVIGAAVGLVSGFYEGTQGARVPYASIALGVVGLGAIFTAHTRLGAGLLIAALVVLAIGWVLPVKWLDGPRMDADTALMRLVDIGLSFPFLLLVMALAAAFDRTTVSTILVDARPDELARDRARRPREDAQVRNLDYIGAARALGQPVPKHPRRARASERVGADHRALDVAGRADDRRRERLRRISASASRRRRRRGVTCSSKVRTCYLSRAVAARRAGVRDLAERARLQPARGGAARCARSEGRLSSRSPLAALGCSEPPAAPLPALRQRERRRAAASFTSRRSRDIKSLDPAVAADTLTGRDHRARLRGARRLRRPRPRRPGSRRALRAQRRRARLPLLPARGPEASTTEARSPPTTCKRSIERALQPDTPSSFATFYDHIDGFDEFNAKKTDAPARRRRRRRARPRRSPQRARRDVPADLRDAGAPAGVPVGRRQATTTRGSRAVPDRSSSTNVGPRAQRHASCASTDGASPANRTSTRSRTRTAWVS